MPKCNKCKTIYNESQRQLLINNKVYWCPLCSNFKIFNPFPATWFAPECNINEVLDVQIRTWETGTRDNYWKNKMKSAST
jgi:hypothetical protein